MEDIHDKKILVMTLIKTQNNFTNIIQGFKDRFMSVRLQSENFKSKEKWKTEALIKAWFTTVWLKSHSSHRIKMKLKETSG